MSLVHPDPCEGVGIPPTPGEGRQGSAALEARWAELFCVGEPVASVHEKPLMPRGSPHRLFRILASGDSDSTCGQEDSARFKTALACASGLERPGRWSRGDGDLSRWGFELAGACPGGLRQAKPSALLPGISSLCLHDTCPHLETGVLPACLLQLELGW